MSSLQLYNSLSRQKEVFEPITPGYVGLYVCGPTVSGESHLGHARPYITFDVVNRWLRSLGNRVRYVRNITDAGHFEEEGRAAQDKVSEKAKLEMLEPMELVMKYTRLYHQGMRAFNNLEPEIEPTATGHIVEQIGMIKKIMAEGYAYEVNGSVYFDVNKYAEKYPYGELSGRRLEDLLENTRELDGQEEKRNQVDFALWKSAPPEHIMRWQSPWGEGFPGWHIECSAMSSKYLGDRFDIHGGGMDLLFPHHESEIAQSTIAHGHPPVRYWMHNNMITINGRKMGKSYNNVIKLTELFSGNHPELAQAYHPMVVRFYILQTHYRSTLDFSNEGLQASEKGLKRLWEAYEALKSLGVGRESGVGSRESLAGNNEAPGQTATGRQTSMDGGLTVSNRLTGAAEGQTATGGQTGEAAGPDARVRSLIGELEDFMNDDFGTARVIANLFELAPVINSIKGGQIPATSLSDATWTLLRDTFKIYIEDVLGLQPMQAANTKQLDEVMALVIDMRKQARARKDFATSDVIRNQLATAGIVLKDEKDGSISWSVQ